MGGIDGTDAVGLAQALTRLLDDARRQLGPGRGASLVRRVTDHVGVALADLPNVALQLPSWEHVTLHKGVEAYVAAHSPGAERRAGRGRRRRAAGLRPHRRAGREPGRDRSAWPVRAVR